MADSPSIEPFIRFGLLPENLPPVINSGSLWQHYEAHKGAYILNKDCVGWLSPYDASKRGNQRRSFSISHPAFVYEQAAFFEKNWKDIGPLFARSPGSRSVPNFPKAGPRATRITPHSELPAIRFRKLSRFKYCLVADVARCFPSIYTHSVPWAIHGKSASKSDTKTQSATIFANRLDSALRSAQDRQTMGIPVGPDTSRLTSEIVLSAVDAEFLKDAPAAANAYIRHVDDYWIGAHTQEEAEAYLRALRHALNSYELDVNELKTRIVRLDTILGQKWPPELKREIEYSFSSFMKSDEDLVSAFGAVIDFANKNSDEGLIRHVIKTIDDGKSWNSEWEITEHFLAQSAVQFPHSLDYVARVIAWRVRSEMDVDRAMWIEVFRNAIAKASGLGRDSEVIWSLWALKELKSKIPKDLSSSICKNNNAISLAFLSHMHAGGLTNDKSIAQTLWDRMEGNSYSGPFWPLTLELQHLGIANSNAVTASGAEAPLRALHDSGMSLFDWLSGPAVFKKKGGKPSSAIEAYTSDYDDSDGMDDEDGDDHVDPGDFDYL